MAFLPRCLAYWITEGSPVGSVATAGLVLAPGVCWVLVLVPLLDAVDFELEMAEEAAVQPTAPGVQGFAGGRSSLVLLFFEQLAENHTLSVKKSNRRK